MADEEATQVQEDVETNGDAVEKAEEHLDDTDLAEDRETLKQLQQDM